MFSFLFFVAIMSAMLTGCSKDDDDSTTNMSTDLTGYWIRYSGDDLEEFGFFADGTCNYEETYDDGENMEYASGTYSIEGEKLTLKQKFDDGEEETWLYTIKSIEVKKKLVLIDEDGDICSYDYYKE